jgi:hypothetical protein
LYDYVLEDEQIREMYNQTKDAHVTIIDEELSEVESRHYTMD